MPGLAVSHATHLTTSGLFCTIQVSHSQLPAGGANKELRLAAGAFAGLLSDLEEESVLGCGAWQATHFLSEGLFCSRQVTQFHDPAAGLNFSPNPEFFFVVVLHVGVTGSVSKEFWVGEANPGPLRISRTLPCFKALAGLKGPSKSSLLSLAFLNVTIAGAGFPFDIEVVVFIVGALKVNPDDGEKDMGLAAVALTMGEEKVNETDVDVDMAFVSLPTNACSETRGIGAVLGVGVSVKGGSWEEKLKVGRLKLLIGRETAGRFGTSATSSSGLLVEGRTLLSRFILPPPAPVTLAAGVLDNGYNRLLVLAVAAETPSGI